MLVKQRRPVKKRLWSDAQGTSTHFAVRPFHAATAALIALFLLCNCSDAFAQKQVVWSNHRTSIADLVIGRQLTLTHGTLDLSPEEHNSYADLLRTIQERLFSVTAEGKSAADSRNEWESSFYKFAAARRKAFLRGSLLLNTDRGGQLADPFSANAGTGNSSERSSGNLRRELSYSLIADMRSHPEDFVGRPVAMYGLFSPSGRIQLEPTGRFDWEPEQLQFQRGVLRSLSGEQALAVVDTQGYVDHMHQNRTQTIVTSGQASAVPVLVKGWFVKLWGQQPLIYTESIRVLEPHPYSEWVQEFAAPRQRLVEQEEWLYYETLRQMDLTSDDVKQQLAADRRRDRIVELKDDVVARQAVELQILTSRLHSAEITQEQFDQQKTRLERQVSLRKKRYSQYLSEPELFPVYVDIFQHPDAWQGELVTMTGHVRHCLTYTADDVLMPGQTLHELWLFTDDSQHNPAVIITTELPNGFPQTADVIDRVSVTGCFFKMYVYSGQENRRLAPLLLAGNVRWNPTDEHVLTLAEAGYLKESDSRVRIARDRSQKPVSDSILLLGGFAALLVMMTIWGRVQRDRRERERLLQLVDEQPDFHQTESIV